MIVASKYAKVLVMIAILASSSLAFSEDGLATFESFYRSGVLVNWVMAGLASAIVAILVFVGLPILAPTMAATIGTIGTSIGGLFGLSGVAATNAGLALLGGGAIATGGFGVIGGTAVLAAALTFGTEVIFDYASGTLISTYEAKQFSEASKKMLTLPIPANFSGPDSVKEAGKALDSKLFSNSWTCAKRFPESIDEFTACLAAVQAPQRQRIQYALAAMDVHRGSTMGAVAQEREMAMYALLYFLNNDYVAAKSAALQAYKLGIAANDTPTVAAFIVAASMLYEESPNLSRSLELFQYSITAEPKNSLTPVLFAAYLDRLSYRLNDGAAGVDHFDRLGGLAGSLADDERKLVIQQELLSRCIMHIKLDQQKIVSITGTQNSVVSGNPKALEVVRASLRDYGQLVSSGNTLVARQNALLPILASNTSLWDRMMQTPNPFTDEINGWPKAMQQFKNAMLAYKNGQKELQGRVTRFEKEVEDAKVEKSSHTSEGKKSWFIVDWIKKLIK